MAQVQFYSIPTFDGEGNFAGYRQIEGDPQPGNGSRNARRCITASDVAAQASSRPIKRTRKGYWGRIKL